MDIVLLLYLETSCDVGSIIINLQTFYEDCRRGLPSYEHLMPCFLSALLDSNQTEGRGIDEKDLQTVQSST